LFPPTLIYNEGWLLRLILDWFSTHRDINHTLAFPENAQWFSEAMLPSAFQARYRGDKLAESRTHADGVIGQFLIGNGSKTGLSLMPQTTHFLVLEAKMPSGLSSNVRNVRNFDQAARNVACIAELFHRANLSPATARHIGFYVLAPHAQITRGVFNQFMNRESLQQKVKKRVQDYKGDKDQWYSEWFLPTLQQIEIATISWEELIETVNKQDTASAISIKTFYKRCLDFN
jgi:hypothetical protein